MLKILIFIFILNFIKCEKVCFDQLGCFIDTYPFSGTWSRPFSLLPESPQKIDVKFTLYNRKLLNHSEPINATIITDNFDSKISTKFIIHGFLQNANRKWIIRMKNELLKAEDVNVITVDWSKGSVFPYMQAVANSQITGAEMARLIDSLIKFKKVNPQSVHLIGHSLGAQISGYAGQRVPGLGRISGLDPAALYFENTDPKVRLDPTDAEFVDIIHSDSFDMGLGISQSCGHVDYYVNGGFNQPDCPAKSGKFLSIFSNRVVNIENIEKRASCSHLAAIYYYLDSINNNKCKYTSYPCNSSVDFDKGKCLSCSSKGCNKMGYWSSPSKELGSLYLNTQSPLNDEYCKQHYAITLVSNSKNDFNITQTMGKFSIILETAKINSTSEILDDSTIVFKADSIEKRLISINKPLLNEIENIYLTFNKYDSFFNYWFYNDKWSFKYVGIVNGDLQTINKFCPLIPIINSSETVKFVKC